MNAKRMIWAIVADMAASRPDGVVILDDVAARVWKESNGTIPGLAVYRLLATCKRVEWKYPPRVTPKPAELAEQPGAEWVEPTAEDFKPKLKPIQKVNKQQVKAEIAATVAA